jgi:hypothetical protein
MVCSRKVKDCMEVVHIPHWPMPAVSDLIRDSRLSTYDESVLKLSLVLFRGKCARTGHPLKLLSLTKLARLGHFPAARPGVLYYIFSLVVYTLSSQLLRTACCVCHADSAAPGISSIYTDITNEAEGKRAGPTRRPPGWLAESDPEGCDFVREGRYMPPALTDHTTCFSIGMIY